MSEFEVNNTDVTGPVGDAEGFPEPEPLRCNNAGDGKCQGEVQHRLIGKYPRCDYHYQRRLKLEDEINRKYPYHQPADFDPTYAGERWDDDY
jgi:hypothetical protein